jgi:hypothetical protein
MIAIDLIPVGCAETLARLDLRMAQIAAIEASIRSLPATPKLTDPNEWKTEIAAREPTSEDADHAIALEEQRRDKSPPWRHNEKLSIGVLRACDATAEAAAKRFGVDERELFRGGHVGLLARQWMRTALSLALGSSAAARALTTNVSVVYIAKEATEGENFRAAQRFAEELRRTVLVGEKPPIASRARARSATDEGSA